ncbi:MAG: preprotein translocase subunit SecE [Verrucomicrobia bacterium]|nr:MAG: preprotein translocase subunit SecE [Verrucomicrobiota bacterium]
MGKIQAWWSAVRTFFDEVRVELKKCSWPSWGELKESTLVVIFSVVLLGVFVGFSDLVLNGILRLVIK